MFTFYAASHRIVNPFLCFFIQSCWLLCWRVFLRELYYLHFKNVVRENKKKVVIEWNWHRRRDEFDINIYFHIKMADHTWLLKYSWWFACFGMMCPWIKNDCEWCWCWWGFWETLNILFYCSRLSLFSFLRRIFWILDCKMKWTHAKQKFFPFSNMQKRNILWTVIFPFSPYISIGFCNLNKIWFLNS